MQIFLFFKQSFSFFEGLFVKVLLLLKSKNHEEDLSLMLIIR